MTMTIAAIPANSKATPHEVDNSDSEDCDDSIFSDFVKYGIAVLVLVLVLDHPAPTFKSHVCTDKTEFKNVNFFSLFYVNFWRAGWGGERWGKVNVITLTH